MKIGQLSRKLYNLPLRWWCLGLYLAALLWRGSFYVTHVNFAQDQARDLMVVQEMADRGNFILAYGSKASVADFHWPPLYYQILMVVGRLTQFNPLAPHWFFVASESVTPIFLFLILRFFIRNRYALLTALIYLVSPAATIYGTFSWNPNLIPLFTAASIYCFLTYYFLKKPKFLIWGSFLPLWAFQLHFQAGLIMLFYLGYLIWCIKENKHNLKYILIGWGLAFLVYLPYLTTEMQNHWDNTLKIYAFFAGEHTRIYDRVSKPDFVLNYIPGFFERVIYNANVKWHAFGLPLLAGGMALFGWLSYRDKKKYLILLLLIVSMLFMVRVYKGDKLDYYLSAIFIVPYFLLGLIVNQLKKIGLGLAIVVLGLSFWATVSIPYENGYLTMQRAVSHINEFSNGPVNLITLETDFEYPIIYGLLKTGRTIDNTSKTMVLICKPLAKCDSNLEAVTDQKIIGPYKIAVFREAE